MWVPLQAFKLTNLSTPSHAQLKLSTQNFVKFSAREKMDHYSLCMCIIIIILYNLYII